VPIGEGQRRARRTLARLRKAHPDARCALVHEDPFQLLVATVLSAQTTDTAVNQVTVELFQRWGNAEALSRARVSDVERVINRIGMYRQKARNIVGLANRIVKMHGGRVPSQMAQLVELPGVGRKTANVVLGVAFARPEGIVVDTHVARLSQRLGWTAQTDPVKIERDLLALFPRSSWDALGHTLIFHGRRVCSAARPACSTCAINDACPSAYCAENVGRKPKRSRGRTD